MFISVLELFKIGIGPSSSHTHGPMVAALSFKQEAEKYLNTSKSDFPYSIQCVLKGSLAYTGEGHSTDRAITLGLHGYNPKLLSNQAVDTIIHRISLKESLSLEHNISICFSPKTDIIFDQNKPLTEHPNGMVFNLLDKSGKIVLSKIYFSIGGGFIKTMDEINNLDAPLNMKEAPYCPFDYNSAKEMLNMSKDSNKSIAEMKRLNELEFITNKKLIEGLDDVWNAMLSSIANGLLTSGFLPGGLKIPKRAKTLYQTLKNMTSKVTVNDWLCAYAMAVTEENASGNMIVTAPTNGASGVIPAVLNYFVEHENGTQEQVREFLLTASAIGSLIKQNSSISGAEVGCQGEIGSAASMAAAGLCAAKGGTPEQVEHAAEMALEHHLGMTCDPVRELVQVPCIERNGFGAIKAYAAASLALYGDGKHFMPLDSCIKAMKETGMEMSTKYKETSLGGLAVNITEC